MPDRALLSPWLLATIVAIFCAVGGLLGIGYLQGAMLGSFVAAISLLGSSFLKRTNSNFERGLGSSISRRNPAMWLAVLGCITLVGLIAWYLQLRSD
jgi:hypothetical protein